MKKIIVIAGLLAVGKINAKDSGFDINILPNPLPFKPAAGVITMA